MNKRVTILVATQEWQAFKRACRLADRSASQELRSYVREYVRRYAQGQLMLEAGEVPAQTHKRR